MLKTFEAILLVCMSLLLFSLCGCSDSGAKQEDLLDRKVTVIESVEKISANFDKAQSLHMASVMGGNRALIADGKLWCFDYDGDYSPVLACYELTDGVPGNFSILAEDCVPACIALAGDRLYYINQNGSSSIESIRTDGSDRQVLMDEPCSFLQLEGGKMYFCDAAGRFCSSSADGSGKTVLIEDICCYTYYFGGWVLYQSGNDGESLHLLCLDDGKDLKLSSTVSYAPMIIENTLYYTQKTTEGSRICSLTLDEGLTQVYSPLIQGAAEFVDGAGQGWTVRAMPADERLGQSSIPPAELDGGVWRQGGYSGYRLCDWAGEQRVDAFYENGGRLRSFVFVDENGNETEYIAGEVRQK